MLASHLLSMNPEKRAQIALMEAHAERTAVL